MRRVGQCRAGINRLERRPGSFRATAVQRRRRGRRLEGGSRLSHRLHKALWRRKSAQGLFPEEIAQGVFRCGFNARASYGAHSYFLQRSEGNLLIDSPRYIRRFEKFFEERGGIAAVL